MKFSIRFDIYCNFIYTFFRKIGMSVLKTAFGLVKQVVNPKNYTALDDAKNRTTMPDTLTLDASGRVKVDYRNEKVRRRVRTVFSDLQKFQPIDSSTTRHTR